MANKPVIVIQLIHIEGPLKGEIQDFPNPEVSIGRHSSCHVRFPKDLRIVSREHARIIREGNRFKLMNLSKNGTYLNGKRIPEAYLKDGDVLMFAHGGPKLSFLTRIEAGRKTADISTPVTPEPPRTSPEISIPHTPEPPQGPPKISTRNKKVPLIIQYGPTLRSFNELPVTIGKGPGCDFILNHPSLLNQHAQLFFSQNQYWVKDLTGRQSVSVNDQPINIQAPLNPDNRLALSPQGPRFRFLEGGRLAEIEEPGPEYSLDEPPVKEKLSIHTMPEKDEPKKKGSILKKLFS
jgi:pSer/pThr/pTyr-binding forkhead associated (FHA) protein